MKNRKWLTWISLAVALVLSVGLLGTAIVQAQGDAKAFLGISIFDNNGQVVIRSVVPDSPAAEVGLERGDIITEYDNRSLESARELVDYIATLEPGDELLLTVERDGELSSYSIVLTEAPGAVSDTDTRPDRPDRPRDDNRGPDIHFFPTASERFQLGVRYSALTPEIAEAEDLATEEGALVEEVVPDSPAADAGLEPGDIIIAVDGDAVDIEHTLSDRLYAYEAQDQVTLTVLRDGEELEIGAVLAADHPAKRFNMPLMPFDHARGPQIDLPFDHDFIDPPFDTQFMISDEPPSDIADGQQAYECEGPMGTFYVVVPQQTPNLLDCVPYEG